MKKQSKSLLIAIAAFAVTATGVSAHTEMSILNDADLEDEQILAIEMARELREEGDLTGARDTLFAAGISEGVLKRIGKASRKSNNAVKEAVDNNDFDLFLEEVDGTPLAEEVTSEADFDLFVEAHELLKSGNFKEAKEIFDELGIERLQHQRHGNKKHRGSVFSELTDEQASAYEIAKEANDKGTMQSILEEAGLDCRAY